MTDMYKEFERCDLNMIASNAKESYDKLKELNRAVVKKEDILRMAIQDRILGVIPDDELERITREAKLANDACFDEKRKLRRLITRLRDIVDELNHVVFNAEYSCAEMDTSINIAMIFSDVKNMEGKE